jgi:glycosyltransferase involved in cell wall biosynthesis
MASGATADETCLANFDRVWDVEWSRNPLDPTNLLTAPSKVREVVEQGDYDIVHVHTPIAAFVTRFALRSRPKHHKPVVIYTAHGFHFYRGGNPLRNALFFGLEKLAGQWTDYLVVINREDEEMAKRWKLVSPERVRYMPGIGVDLSYYNPYAIPQHECNHIRQELQLSPDTPLLLVLAEFTVRKRHQDILRAFAQLNHPTACLVMAGPGPLIEAMQQLSLELGIQDRVRFLGFRHDVPVLIRTATALILASEHEGLPRSVMEALCLETPVIGTDVRGTRDLLSEQHGLLVQLGNIAELTKAMAWVIEHPQEAKAIAQWGRQQMPLYDVQNILTLHDELYAIALQDDCMVKQSWSVLQN